MRKLHLGWTAATALVLTVCVVFGPTWALPGPDPAGVPVAAADSRRGEQAVAAATRPNVIVILTDDETAASLSRPVPAPFPRPMPYLHSKLQDPASGWVQFPNTFVNTALCCPSRATILTGQNSHHTGVIANLQAKSFRDAETSATWLDRAGYRTGFFGKYLNGYPWTRGLVTPPGWDEAALFDYRKHSERYYDYDLIRDNGTIESHGNQPEDYLTDVLARKGVDFVRRNPEGQPFYLYLTPLAGHHPWTAAPRHLNRYDGMPPVRTPNFNEADVSDKPAWVRASPLLSPAEVSAWDRRRAEAYATLTSVDDALRALEQELASKGVLDQTVIIFTSDHGHTYGEHRKTYKKCPYDECERVPFFVRYPGAVGRVDMHAISNADIAPTLAELANVTPPIAEDGSSLVPLLENRATSWRGGVLIAYRETRCPDQCPPIFWGIRNADFTYVEYDNGERELYDLTGKVGSADPYELDNRAAKPAYAATRQYLSALITELR